MKIRLGLHGNRCAARRRMEIMDTLPELLVTDEVVALFDRIVSVSTLPTKAHLDIFYISVAAVYEMSYLMTWNCKHINNSIFKKKIREEILLAGYSEVDMTTPEELMEAV